MYTIALKRDFTARHHLIGGDWGDENQPHPHHYLIEVRLEGPNLDRHGFLVDICDIETVLDGLVNHYRDKLLNELPEFRDLNPSLEHFARIFCRKAADQIQTHNLSTVVVRLWENEMAWAEYRKNI